jgi:hypothetical protein
MSEMLATTGMSPSISKTQHTERPGTPPMAYVEEEFLEEPIQFPLKYLLFTVPDDLLFPSTNKASTCTQDAMEGTTCIVEEEFQDEIFHMAPSASLQDNASEDDVGSKVVKDDATNTMQENLPILVPPPLNAIKEFDPTPPSLFSPK